MSNQSPKDKRITKIVNQEVVEWKINVLPWETLMHRNMCDKKQIVRESAEVVVGIRNNTKGLNVYIVQIATSNVQAVRNEE